MNRKKPAQARLSKAQPTYGQYLAAVQSGSLDRDKVEDDRYAMQQYRQMFADNHRRMDQARMENAARLWAKTR